MFNWFWSEQQPAPHRCEEFTRWVARIENVRIVADSNGKAFSDEQQYEVAKYFQERRCTLCGKVYQEPLQYDSIFDDDEDDDD